MIRDSLVSLIALTSNLGLALIVDEALAFTLHSSSAFCSALSLVEGARHVAVVSGLSKVGLAGIRVGAIYSLFDWSRLEPRLAYSQISGDAKCVVADLFGDVTFVVID